MPVALTVNVAGMQMRRWCAKSLTKQAASSTLGFDPSSTVSNLKSGRYQFDWISTGISCQRNDQRR
jgi:hypothetical protein